VVRGSGGRGGAPPPPPPPPLPPQKTKTASVREHRAVSDPSTLNDCAVKKMVDEDSTPTVTSQECQSGVLANGTVWSIPIDIKFQGGSLNFLNWWKPQRQRRKELSDSPDAYLDRRAAAAYLRLSVRFLEGNTSIPKTNFAGVNAKRPTWRYKRSDLDAWAAERAQRRSVGRAE
jgi:hypothetical protein